MALARATLLVHLLPIRRRVSILLRGGRPPKFEVRSSKCFRHAGRDIITVTLGIAPPSFSAASRLRRRYMRERARAPSLARTRKDGDASRRGSVDHEGGRNITLCDGRAPIISLGYNNMHTGHWARKRLLEHKSCAVLCHDAVPPLGTSAECSGLKDSPECERGLLSRVEARHREAMSERTYREYTIVLRTDKQNIPPLMFA
ncbi:hypothetical protein OBBRIDRAFT_863480 [Obba rivulosa]|uniref:Uncharacterized protein n=1 Tax=Obba rivulosa TaxID=1052685 RepID=A0A8E2AMD1_9APHY|nr:hypothetical protein OBBRIDRAFT_863480 [Obba rivulosa]